MDQTEWRQSINKYNLSNKIFAVSYSTQKPVQNNIDSKIG